MEPSSIGLGLFALLFFVALSLGSGPFVGLMIALPFGSTAFVGLPRLGGSTPPIYMLFAVILVVNTFARRSALEELRSVFARQRSAWIVLSLMVLAVVGAIVLPRLFAGETVSLLPVDKVYRESPLRPSFKNVTQGGYLLLGTLVYLAMSMTLLQKPRSALIVKAFLAFCIAHTACGLIDLVAKYAFGESDVFAAVRTANYAMISADTVAGFPRLTGAMPEASTFAGTALACLGFSYVYWRGTGSRLALSVTLINLVLILMSTSTTAYAGLVVLCLPLAWRVLRSIQRDGRPLAEDLRIALAGIAAAVVSLALMLTYDRPSAVVDMLNVAVVEKASSSSGTERFYFNAVSVRNFVDTYGLGAGLGSSRASGWPIAVLGQLGLLGVVLMALLVFAVARGMTGVRPTRETHELIVVGNSVSAAAIGSLVAASISQGSADPGIVFFVALAVVSSWRWHARNTEAIR